MAGMAITAATSRLAFDVMLPPEPVVLGVESRPLNNAAAAARTRRGWSPPPPLGRLAADSIAVADAVLFRPLPNRALPASIDLALPMMPGSTSISRDEKVGVSYGVRPRRFCARRHRGGPIGCCRPAAPHRRRAAACHGPPMALRSPGKTRALPTRPAHAPESCPFCRARSRSTFRNCRSADTPLNSSAG